MVRAEGFADADAVLQRIAKGAGKAVRDGLVEAKNPIRQILKRETAQAFSARPGSRIMSSWRIAVEGRGEAAEFRAYNKAPWFYTHVEGARIGPRRGSKLAIPINTRLGTRITNDKFRKLLSDLRASGQTVIKNDVVYIKPVLNKSRRGGVAKGSRVNKKFRRKVQGSIKRPSGFELNGTRLAPIAVLKSGITMRKRFDADRVLKSRMLPEATRLVLARLDALADGR